MVREKEANDDPEPMDVDFTVVEGIFATVSDKTYPARGQSGTLYSMFDAVHRYSSTYYWKKSPHGYATSTCEK